MHILPYCIRFTTQFLIFLSFKLYLLIHRIPSQPSLAIKARTTHIIASNHQHALDPFVIVSNISFTDFFRLAPFCFITANIFYKPWTIPFLWLAGCFRAKPGGRSSLYGIDGAVTLIRRGYTLVIFPEGRRTKLPLPAKRGLGEIMKQVGKVEVILARIQWSPEYKPKFIRMKIPDHKPITSEAVMEAVYTL